MFISNIRNRSGIQFESLRKTIDPDYEKLHDSLSSAYYDYWRFGKSKPWQGYDVQATKEESKALFDKLHGMIFDEYHLKFHEENQKLPEKDQIPEDEYNTLHDDTGKIVGYKSVEITDKLSAEKAKGYEIDTIKLTG